MLPAITRTAAVNSSVIGSGIAVTAELIRRAAMLVEDPVRAYDSIHLAAAEAAGNLARGRAEFRFAAFDDRLLEVARSNALALLTPE